MGRTCNCARLQRQAEARGVVGADKGVGHPSGQTCLQSAQLLLISLIYLDGPSTRIEALAREVTHLNVQVTDGLRRSDLPSLAETSECAWSTARAKLEAHSSAYRQALYNWAAAAFRLGRFIDAERALTTLLSGLCPAIGADVRVLSAAQNLLGLLRIDEGRLREAEHCFETSIAAIEQIGLPHDANTAQAFGNLAEVMRERNDFAAAAPLYERCLGYLPEGDPNLALERARWLVNVAYLYIGADQPLDARPLLTEALGIRRAIQPAGHPDIARVDSALAAIAITQGEFGDAVQSLEGCITTYRRTYGKGSVAEASALNMLGGLEALGATSRVEPRLHELIAAISTSLGGGHPSLEALWMTAARLRRLAEDLSGAMACLDRTTAVHERGFREIVGATSEAQWFRFARRARRTSAEALSLARAGTGGLDQSAFHHVLATEGIVFRAQALWRDVALGRAHPDLQADVQQLRALGVRIAKLGLAGPGAAGWAFQRDLLDQLTREKSRLEASVVSRIPAIGASKPPPDLDELRCALPPRSALIHYVLFPELPTAFPPTGVGSATGVSRRYAVFVLRREEGPRLLDLGDARVISGALRDFLEAILAGGGDPESTAWRAPGAALRQLVLDPVSPWLEDLDHLFIVPDGELTRPAVRDFADAGSPEPHR